MQMQLDKLPKLKRKKGLPISTSWNFFIEGYINFWVQSCPVLFDMLFEYCSKLGFIVCMFTKDFSFQNHCEGCQGFKGLWYIRPSLDHKKWHHKHMLCTAQGHNVWCTRHRTTSEFRLEEWNCWIKLMWCWPGWSFLGICYLGVQWL